MADLPTTDDLLPKPSVDELLGAPIPEFEAAQALSGEHWDEYMRQSTAGRILGAIGRGAAEGWGTSRLGFDEATEEGLKKTGIFPDVQKGQGGIVRAINEALLRPLAVGVDAALRAGGVAFSGAQAGVAQAGAELGAPGLGREVAAIPEAFFGMPGGLGVPRLPEPLGRAQEFRLLEGERAWKGLTEQKEPPPEAINENIARAREVAAQVHEPGAPEPGALEPSPAPLALPAPRPPADVHEAARQVAPDTFREYDELGQQQQVLRDRIAEQQEELRQQAVAQAPHAAEIQDLERRLEDTTPRLAKKYEARLEELRPAYDAFLADDFTMGALTRDTDEIAALRAQLQQVDYRRRDLAPDVSAAYLEAAKQFPEQPVAAPAAPAEAAAVEPAAPVAAPAPVAPEEAAAAAAQPRIVPAPAPAAEVLPAGLRPPEVRPRTIAEDVARKLVAAGRPEDEAAAAGQLLQAHYETRAARFAGAKGSAEDLYRAEGPNIRGAEKGGRAGAAAGKAFIKDDRTTITLFAKADASTFLHETGHQWLEELIRDAGDEKAPAGLKADAQAVRDWLGQEKAQAPSRFTTAKGSVYELHEDGTTTRNKSYHPEHGKEDVGLKARSEKTIYVNSREQASPLSAAGITDVGGKGYRLILKDGKASLLSWNKAGNRWGVAPSSRDIPFTTIPEVGKVPVEAWRLADDVPGYEAYKEQHAGNPITAVERAAPQEITGRQHERFARGFEQYLMEGRAPTRALAGVFRQFRDWLTKIYTTMTRLGRPISDDIRDVFDRLITTNPDREPIVAPQQELPFREESRAAGAQFHPVPKEPMRLVSFLRKMGGVRDEGGDIASMLGGSRYRPGLINTTGLSLDEAARQAWESGYLPEFKERPTTNDLLKAIDDDLRGNARYAETDREAVARREEIMSRNSEIQRIADAHNINPADMTRAEFFDRVADAMSFEEMAREQTSLDEAHAAAFHGMADEAKDYVESRGDRWDQDAFYGLHGPRTLGELEDENRQENAARPEGQGAAGIPESATSSGSPGYGEEGIRHGGRAPGAPGGGAAEANRETAGAAKTAPRGERPAARAAGGTPADERPAGPNEPFRPAARLIDKAGNIRLDNLNTPEDVNQVLREFAEQHGGYEGARRGVVSDAAVIQLADAIGATGSEMNLAKLRQMSLDDPFPFAARVRAGRQMLVQAATAMRDAMARAATGSEADIMAFVQAADKLNMIQETVSGVTAEWGRAGRAFRELKPEAGEAASLAQIAEQTTGKTLFQLQEMAKLGSQLQTPAQLAKFARDLAPPTLWQNVKAGIISYFVNGLISGPITHGAYGVGNTMLALYKAVPETLAQAAVGEARHLITGEAEDRVRFGEAGAQLYAMVRGLRNGFVPGMKALESGVFVPLNVAQGELLPALPRPQAIPGKIGYALETPGRVVTMIHTLFYTMGYTQEIARLAYRDASTQGLRGEAFNQRVAELSQAPPPEMMDAAHTEGMRMVLMERPKYGSSRYHISQAVNNNLTAKIIMPFMQIGTNILQQGIVERTPLAMLRSEARAEILGTRGGAAFDLRAGKILAGSLLAVAVPIGLAAEGLLTGGGPPPSEADKRRVLEESGWKAYSFKWGDTYIPYRKFLGPLGPLVATSVDAYEIGHTWSEEGLGKAAAALAFGFSEVVADESWMSGLSQFVDALRHWDTHAEQYIRGLATSFMPFSSLSRQTARLVDPYQRQARSIVDAARNITPFVSEGLEPQISIWGQPIPSHMMISPSTAKNDPVDQRLIDLDMGVRKLDRKIFGVELTDAQYTEYAQLAGRMAKMRLDALVGTPGFSSVMPGLQQKMIHETITDARETAQTIVALTPRNLGILNQANANKAMQLIGVKPK